MRPETPALTNRLQTSRPALTDLPGSVNRPAPSPSSSNATTGVPKGMDRLIHITPVPVPVIPAGGLGRQAALGKENLAAQGTTGKKRKSTEAAPELGLGINLSHIDCRGMAIDANCDQVRRKINAWLDAGVMTKGAFCAAINVSMKSLNGFLAQNGRDKGMGFSAYQEAWEFFKKRELAGLPMPKKQRMAGGPGGAGAGTGCSAPVDISDVVLPGETSDKVPVYDSCDEIRKKITAHLAKPGVTQAQFCRDLLAQLQGPSKPKNIQSVQLARFRNTRGATAGTRSPCYYASYVFFEKIRIKEGKPKSKHREEMENIWKGGMDLTHDSRIGGFWCLANETPHIDQYGRLSFATRR
ncbi:hypothetical protein GQ53DRAFT_747637 [Thozetella sp. PMI_491]|nr:hypothetical protein GQ53DRAFT_747637 [Thozetella sp. PMI_491]